MAARKQARYHHGDLRRVLLDATLQLAVERGINGFTLREVARQAGVSHNAPYHHFADKGALITALVTEYFEALAQALQTAVSTTPGTVLDKFLAIGVAYVRFAVEHKAAFRLMYRPELRQSTALTYDVEAGSATLVECVGRGYQILVDSIVTCQEDGWMSPGDPKLRALTAWATVHGLATLLLDGASIGMMHTAADNTAVAHITSLVTTLLVHGLAADTLLTRSAAAAEME